jgi:hypothetical protein
MNIAPKYCVIEKQFDKMDFKTIENTVTTFYMRKSCDHSPEEIAMLDTGMTDVNDLLRFVYKNSSKLVAMGEADTLENAMQQGICYYQNYIQVKSWNRRKQVYTFDADMLNELIRTDISDIVIPYDAFEYLPYRSLYLDFSANSQIVKTVGADGCLVQIQSVTLRETGDQFYQFCVILSSFYKDNEITMMKAVVLPNDKNDVRLSVDEFTKAYDSKLGLYVSETGICPEEMRPELQGMLVVQCLLYLCSYQPDIHETTASKMQYRKVKKAVKSGKQLPVREYVVGERFGEAFRKWTKGCLGQSSEHTPTGRKNKPHMRRAHYHRFWTGKRDSDERRLVTRWVHECFCGLTEDEAEGSLDTVRHEVREGVKPCE